MKKEAAMHCTISPCLHIQVTEYDPPDLIKKKKQTTINSFIRAAHIYKNRVYMRKKMIKSLNCYNFLYTKKNLLKLFKYSSLSFIKHHINLLGSLLF